MVRGTARDVGRQRSASLAPRLLLSPPEAGADEIDAVREAIESGWIAPAGDALAAFETDLARLTDAEAVVAVSSGTAALHLALLALGVEPGQEVVVQTTTFAASAFAVTYTGATPVFCDVDEATGMLDPELLDEWLRARAARGARPAAVMPVDLYGACADYARIRQVCDAYEVPIIQDAFAINEERSDS